jgi:hypothetical protein
MSLSWLIKSSVLTVASVIGCCLLGLANLFPSAWKYEPIVRLLSIHSSELFDELDWLLEMTADEAAVVVNLRLCPIFFSRENLQLDYFK